MKKQSSVGQSKATGARENEKASPWIRTAERPPTSTKERGRIKTQVLALELRPNTELFPVLAWYYRVVKQPLVFPFWMPIPPVPEGQQALWMGERNPKPKPPFFISKDQHFISFSVPTDVKEQQTSLSVGERCAEKITAFLATPESRSFWATDDCSEIATIINQEVNATKDKNLEEC